MRTIAIASILLGTVLIGGTATADDASCRQLKAQFERTCGNNAGVANNRDAVIMGMTCGFALVAIQQCERQQRAGDGRDDMDADGNPEENND
jgi:hypothetical protein